MECRLSVDGKDPHSTQLEELYRSSVLYVSLVVDIEQKEACKRDHCKSIENSMLSEDAEIQDFYPRSISVACT